MNEAPPIHPGPLPESQSQFPFRVVALILGLIAVPVGATALWFWTSRGSAPLLASLALLVAFLVIGAIWAVVLVVANTKLKAGSPKAWLVVPFTFGAVVFLVTSGLGERARFAYARTRLEQVAKAALKNPSIAGSYSNQRIGGEYVINVESHNGMVFFHLPGAFLDWQVLVYCPAGPPATFHRQVGAYTDLGNGWFEYEYKF